jgi:predicted CXXCH cytochrome family protein
MGSRGSVTKVVLLIFLLLWITALPARPLAPAPSALEPHDFRAYGMDCRSCHLSVGLRQRGGMVRPVGEICSGCHKLLGSSHPVGIKPSMTIPPDLPLDDRRMMTCTTCHDPHAEYVNRRTGEKTMYLRRPEPGKQFCMACHNR